ncbi:MAG: DUF1043 family protein [Pseudomonadaceae bacterium]|nr:DUF1043 family protein [Pseudomonadaceae bacterium]
MDPVTVQIIGGVVIAVVALLIGLMIGRTTGKARKASDLADELEKTKEEFDTYRGEVVQQFADTAGKFRRLNESYGDLHKQLATSAAVLCADRADDILLALPDASGEAAAPVDAGDVIEAADEPVADAAAETAVTSPIDETINDQGSSSSEAQIVDVELEADANAELAREIDEAALAEAESLKNRTAG